MLDLNKIYNMDCIEGMKLIDSESIDLIVSDPPYNTGMSPVNHPTGRFRDKGKRLGKFFNDNLSFEDYSLLVNNYLNDCFRILKPNKAIYIYILIGSLWVYG